MTPIMTINKKENDIGAMTLNSIPSEYLSGEFIGQLQFNEKDGYSVRVGGLNYRVSYLSEMNPKDIEVGTLIRGNLIYVKLCTHKLFRINGLCAWRD